MLYRLLALDRIKLRSFILFNYAQLEFASTHDELYSYILDRFRDDYGFTNATHKIGNQFATTVSTDREGSNSYFLTGIRESI